MALDQTRVKEIMDDVGNAANFTSQLDLQRNFTTPWA